MNTKSKFARPLFTLVAAVALTFGAITIGAPSAQAGGGHGRGHQSHCHVPVYKIRTLEVCRHRHFSWKHNHCGQAYQAWYTVITYKDIYSNGTSKTYKITQWS